MLARGCQYGGALPWLHRRLASTGPPDGAASLKRITERVLRTWVAVRRSAHSQEALAEARRALITAGDGGGGDRRKLGHGGNGRGGDRTLLLARGRSVRGGFPRLTFSTAAARSPGAGDRRRSRWGPPVRKPAGLLAADVDPCIFGRGREIPKDTLKELQQDEAARAAAAAGEPGPLRGPGFAARRLAAPGAVAPQPRPGAHAAADLAAVSPVVATPLNPADVSVASFAASYGGAPPLDLALELASILLSEGTPVTPQTRLKVDEAELLAAELGLPRPQFLYPPAEGGSAPQPVVAVLGHVDHGKTTLLDALRGTDVARNEAGKITQRASAFEFQLAAGAKVTFLDTPGHATFEALRATCSRVADLVLLLVAADAGVMPQTLSALHHARQFRVPVLFGVTKTDRATAATLEQVRASLEAWRHPSERVVKLCAKAGPEGLRDLLAELPLAAAAAVDGKCMPPPSRSETASAAVLSQIADAALGEAGGRLACIHRRGIFRPGDLVVAGPREARLMRVVPEEAGEPLRTGEPFEAVVRFTSREGGARTPGPPVADLLRFERSSQHRAFVRQRCGQGDQAAASLRASFEARRQKVAEAMRELAGARAWRLNPQRRLHAERARLAELGASAEPSGEGAADDVRRFAAVTTAWPTVKVAVAGADQALVDALVNHISECNSRAETDFLSSDVWQTLTEDQRAGTATVAWTRSGDFDGLHVPRQLEVVHAAAQLPPAGVVARVRASGDTVLICLGLNQDAAIRMFSTDEETRAICHEVIYRAIDDLEALRRFAFGPRRLASGDVRATPVLAASRYVLTAGSNRTACHVVETRLLQGEVRVDGDHFVTLRRGGGNVVVVERAEILALRTQGRSATIVDKPGDGLEEGVLAAASCDELLTNAGATEALSPSGDAAEDAEAPCERARATSNLVAPEINGILCALSMMVAHDVYQRDEHGWPDARRMRSALLVHAGGRGAAASGALAPGERMTPERFLRLWELYESVAERDNNYYYDDGDRRRSAVAADRARASRQQERHGPAFWRAYATLALDMYQFLADLQQHLPVSTECFIIAGVYLARLLNNDLHLAFTASSWRPALFACVLVAHKYWDDDYLSNHDFVTAYYPHQAATANALERTTLKLLDYAVGVPPSLYAQAYFVLEAAARILVRHVAQGAAGVDGAHATPGTPGARGECVEFGDFLLRGDLDLFRQLLLRALYGTHAVTFATQQLLGSRQAANSASVPPPLLASKIPAVGGCPATLALPAADAHCADASHAAEDGTLPALIRPILTSSDQRTESSLESFAGADAGGGAGSGAGGVAGGFRRGGAAIAAGAAGGGRAKGRSGASGGTAFGGTAFGGSAFGGAAGEHSHHHGNFSKSLRRLGFHGGDDGGRGGGRGSESETGDIAGAGGEPGEEGGFIGKGSAAEDASGAGGASGPGPNLTVASFLLEPPQWRWKALKKVFKKGPITQCVKRAAGADVPAKPGRHSRNSVTPESPDGDSGWWGHSTLLLLTLLDVHGSSVIRRHFERKSRSLGADLDAAVAAGGASAGDGRPGASSHLRRRSREYVRSRRHTVAGRRSASFDNLEAVKKEFRITAATVPHIIGVHDHPEEAAPAEPANAVVECDTTPMPLPEAVAAEAQSG